MLNVADTRLSEALRLRCLLTKSNPDKHEVTEQFDRFALAVVHSFFNSCNAKRSLSRLASPVNPTHYINELIQFVARGTQTVKNSTLLAETERQINKFCSDESINRTAIYEEFKSRVDGAKPVIGNNPTYDAVTTMICNTVKQHIDRVVTANEEIQYHLSRIAVLINEQSSELHTFTDDIISKILLCKYQFDEPKHLNLVLANLDAYIDLLSNENYEISTQLYNDRLRNIPLASMLLFSPGINGRVKSQILSRIGHFSSFQFPGLEIGPGAGEWTKDLVALDPLYLVDIHQHFLEKTKQTFPDTYQKRLRTYVTTETDLSMLPQGQFGLVFSWAVFNLLPKETIHKYLQEIFKVLRPGGITIFSYNNCESYIEAARYEAGLATYITKTDIINIATSIGFTVSFSDEDYSTGISWMELTKPGILSTIKSGQVLGKILSTQFLT